MKRSALFAVILCIAGMGRAAAAESDKPTLSIARITSNIQEGEKWGFVTRWIILTGCNDRAWREPLLWGTGIGKLNVRAFEQPARVELKKEGFLVSGDASDPFGERTAGDFSLGATISSLDSSFCFRNPNRSGRLSGATTMEVDWQIYSNVERRVIAKVHTAGAYETTAYVDGGFQAILFGALDDSLKKLTSSPEFQMAISHRTGPSVPASASVARTSLTLPGAKAASPMKIPDAVGSVVLVLSGGGHGSGFLVSTDGYLMTAEHVVGSDKYVKIRWSDGLEGLGEVVRTDKKRDVALIKTDPRGRQPLALHRAAPEPGDTVFAIGAPLDVKNQGTVTRGVASANRIMDGFSFIQSDVTINGGNSGGPLLDEQGEVLGIADLTFRERGDVPTGINYFIPIDDALRFLAAEPQ